MIVRSMRTPASAGDEERRRNRDENRRADVLRHERLHDVGRVGAEHHQLAVRHVDDAHHAERDGQADGDEHEHRAEAQAEEQRFDAASRATARGRCAMTRGRRGRPDRCVRSRRTRRRRSCSSSAARRLRTSGASRPASTSDGREARRRSRCRRARPAPARSRFPALTRRVRLDAGPLASAAPRAGSSSDRSISFTAASRTAASGLGEVEARDRRSAATRRSRLFVPIFVSASRGDACPRPSSVTGSTSSSDGERSRRRT